MSKYRIEILDPTKENFLKYLEDGIENAFLYVIMAPGSNGNNEPAGGFDFRNIDRMRITDVHNNILNDSNYQFLLIKER